MGESAKVTKITTLSDFKGLLAKICEEVEKALCSVELETRRAIDWLENGQQNYWRRAAKQLEQKLAQAKNELNRRKLIRASGQKMDYTEQKEAVDLLQRRLQEAQEKIEATRRWARTVHRAVDEYLAQARRLAALVEGDPPASVALLDRIVASLDAYLMLSSAAVPAEPSPISFSAGSTQSEVAGGAAPAIESQVSSGDAAPINTDEPSPEVSQSESIGEGVGHDGSAAQELEFAFAPLTPTLSPADGGEGVRIGDAPSPPSAGERVGVRGPEREPLNSDRVQHHDGGP